MMNMMVALRIGSALFASALWMTAAAADVLPLKRGFYVEVNIPCEQASSNSLVLFLGDRFGATCSVEKVFVHGNASNVDVTERCNSREWFTGRSSYVVISGTEFRMTHRPDGASDVLRKQFRYCPQSSLPEPFRSSRN